MSRKRKKFNVFAETLRVIRTKWSLLRFGIKTVNNYFASLGPFVVFLFGGYLVMQGQLELGSLVAFLSAQEKLYDPWKELIDYYQVYQDASIRYYRTMEYFDAAAGHGMFLPSLPASLAGSVEVSNLGFSTSSGITLLRGVSFSLDSGETMALIGFSGSGKSTLIHCIAKMFDYSSGSIRLDGREVKTMDKGEIIRNVGYIAQQPFIFSGTIRDNLLYAHRAAAGKSTQPEEYQAPELDSLIFALQQAGMFVDVIRFGLNTVLDPGDTVMIDKIVRIREQFRAHFGDSLADCVEFYRDDSYLYHSSVMENIVFATPIDPGVSLLSFADRERFRVSWKRCNSSTHC